MRIWFAGAVRKRAADVPLFLAPAVSHLCRDKRPALKFQGGRRRHPMLVPNARPPRRSQKHALSMSVLFLRPSFVTSRARGESIKPLVVPNTALIPPTERPIEPPSGLLPILGPSPGWAASRPRSSASNHRRPASSPRSAPSPLRMIFWRARRQRASRRPPRTFLALCEKARLPTHLSDQIIPSSG